MITEDGNDPIELMSKPGVIDLRPDKNSVGNGHEGAGWGGDRAVSAQSLVEYASSDAVPVFVRGARIVGRLDLRGHSIDRSIHFDSCYFDEGIDLTDASLRTFKLTNCSIQNLLAKGVSVSGNAVLDGSVFRSGAILTSCQIAGSLSCTGASFYDRTDYCLQLQIARIEGSLWATGLVAGGGISVHGAEVGGNLELDGTTVNKCKSETAIQAEGLRVGGSILMSGGFKCQGEVRLVSSRVGKSLIFDAATISNPGGYCLRADRSVVEDSISFANRFNGEGAVSFCAAKVGSIDGTRAKISHNSPYSLNLSDLKVERGVQLSGCKLESGVSLNRMEIGGDLVFEGAWLNQAQGAPALFSAAARIAGSVYFSGGFKSEGGLVIRRARIQGDFHCDGAKISQTGNPAICIDGTVIEGELSLSQTELVGPLTAVSASSGKVTASRISIHAPGDTALLAPGFSTSTGPFSAQYAQIVGEVYLTDAALGGNLELAHCQFGAPASGVALGAQRIRVRGKIALNNTSITGLVDLQSARIESIISFESAEITSSNNRAGSNLALELRHARVKETVYATFSSIKGGIDLIDCTVGAWRDTKECWPEKLALDGFSYSSITALPHVSVRDRIEWCMKNDSTAGPQQPLSQLAKHLRRNGDDLGARQVGVCRESARRLDSDAARLFKLGTIGWSLVLRILVGYGYRPWRILLPFVGLQIIGTVAFSILQAAGQVRAISPSSTTFSPFRYTVDLLLPVANLKQRELFAISGGGEWIVFGLTLSGWFLAFVLVAALTGAFKRE